MTVVALNFVYGANVAVNTFDQKLGGLGSSFQYIKDFRSEFIKDFGLLLNI